MAGVICAEARHRSRVSSRNRIEAPTAKRVTAQHTPYREGGAVYRTVAGYSEHSVFRTCRLKTAGTGHSTDRMKQGRDPTLVDALVEIRHPCGRPCLADFQAWLPLFHDPFER